MCVNKRDVTVSLKKTEVLSQGAHILPSIKIKVGISKYKNFLYLGSNIALNALLDTEIVTLVRPHALLLVLLQEFGIF